MELETHVTGELAYYDTLMGLIPCKVLSINGSKLVIKITANRLAYKRGEIINTASHAFVIPRKCVYVRSGQYRIRTNYEWKD